MREAEASSSKLSVKAPKMFARKVGKHLQVVRFNGFYVILNDLDELCKYEKSRD